MRNISYKNYTWILSFLYRPTIFKSIGITGQNTSLLTTGVYGILKLVGALVWLLYLVDSYGRRPLLMIGSIGGAIAMYYIGAYIAIAKPVNNVSTSIDAGGKSAGELLILWSLNHCLPLLYRRSSRILLHLDYLLRTHLERDTLGLWCRSFPSACSHVHTSDHRCVELAFRVSTDRPGPCFRH